MLTVANIWEAQKRATTSKSKVKTIGSAPANGCECSERRRAAADFRPELDNKPLSNTDMALGQPLAVSCDKIRDHRRFD
jgi:hypothetical protein